MLLQAGDVMQVVTSDGFHTVTSDQPVGVTVYGYGQYTSYWYPAGAR